MSLPRSSRASCARLARALVPVLLCGPTANAADDVGIIPGVVVTANRTPTPAQDVLADFTVIERDEVARAGPQGLAALLARQPGVEILRNGGPGTVSSVFLRGANRGQTVVLVDGVRIGSSSNGAATLEAIPLDRIERIEILRGPASGLYGADAVGGVIQVFTRAPADALGGHAEVGFGSDDMRAANAGLAGSLGPVRLAVDAGHRESRGFNAIVDRGDFGFNPDRDGYASDSASARASWQWTPDHELSASALRNRLNAQFDAGPASDDRTITVLSTWRVEARDRWSRAWQWRLSAAESVDDSVSRSSSGDFPFRTRQRQYAWQHEISRDPVAFVGGVERREERLASATTFAVTARDTDSAYGLLQWHQGMHRADLNLRRDRSDQFGSRTTKGLAYAWQPLASLRLRAGAATAFKLPTFNDLYFPGFSNPDLRPETARNAEAGATWSAAIAVANRPVTIEASVTAYRNRVRDLIVLECDATFTCVPQNVARAVLEGVTLVLDTRGDATRVHASLDLADPHDADNGLILPRRARRHGVLNVSRAIGPATLTAEMVAAARRYDDAANTRPLAGYALVNLAAEWALGAGWSVLVRGDNVLDRDVRLASQYGNGGASVFAALRWRR